MLGRCLLNMLGRQMLFLVIVSVPMLGLWHQSLFCAFWIWESMFFTSEHLSAVITSHHGLCFLSSNASKRSAEVGPLFQAPVFPVSFNLCAGHSLHYVGQVSVQCRVFVLPPANCWGDNCPPQPLGCFSFVFLFSDSVLLPDSVFRFTF